MNQKICRCFDPAVRPGTDPKETVKDVHRDLIRSVYHNTADGTEKVKAI